MGIAPEDFEYAVNLIDSGFIFEEFALNYISQILGYEFIPVGGFKDRGIDGLEYSYTRKGIKKTIYQVSIVKNSSNKIERTLIKLIENKVDFDRIFYVTNQTVKDQDLLIDKLYTKYKKQVTIWDLKWLSSKINCNQGTLNIFHTFIDSYLHDFSKPGKLYVVGDLVDDPRLFVFLRQQWDSNKENDNLEVILADSLVLFALEGTDSDKRIFMTEDEILKAISKKIAFDPKILYGIIKDRIQIMSTKPRKIKYHKDVNGYCLPYETRVEIQKRNLKDARLHKIFLSQSSNMLRKRLKDVGVDVKNCIPLLEETFNQIYYKQGLEFSDFILKGENPEAFEKNLEDTISSVVDQSSVVEKNKELIKPPLIMTIREMIYNGTLEQKEFLEKLSNTYLMMFLVQCDPKIGLYFSSLASKQAIYVCTSVLVPALSEYYLKPENRRHYNLLKGAKQTGVKLLINETILKELIAHFKMTINHYEKFYKDEEKVYLKDEIQTLYIEEILIRAYFYAKVRKKVNKFYDFIDTFVSPNLRNAEDDLIAWLKEEFGISFIAEESLGIKIDPQEEEKLFDTLVKLKKSKTKARTDTKIILTIYAIRKKNNEAGKKDIFGYRTWWLSIDTMTMAAINKVFKDKYNVSCYMRPDFLYNYICLSPRITEIKDSYKLMFPSLIGVNISYHLPSEIIDCVHQSMEEHKSKNKSRRSAILGDLGYKLITDKACRTKSFVKHYLDEQLLNIAEEK